MDLKSEGSSAPATCDLRIVLLGKSGSGKSSTGNTILGRTAFKTDISPSSVTVVCTKETCHFDERSVSIVDTPGIFDTETAEDELRKEIEKCIAMSEPGPHIFLLVIRLDVRLTEEEKNTVKWIQENFGEDASKYTLVLFTRGDELKEKSIEKYLKESSELTDLIRGCSSRYAVFDNTRPENRTQVADLFEEIDKIVLLNGSCYTKSMYEAAQKIKESKEWWNKWGTRMNSVGNGLLAVAMGTAVPAGSTALLAEEAVGVSMGSYVMFAGAGISKTIGGWMKRDTTDKDKK